jgi:hypothetical protein
MIAKLAGEEEAESTKSCCSRHVYKNDNGIAILRQFRFIESALYVDCHELCL